MRVESISITSRFDGILAGAAAIDRRRSGKLMRKSKNGYEFINQTRITAVISAAVEAKLCCQFAVATTVQVVHLHPLLVRTGSGIDLLNVSYREKMNRLHDCKQLIYH